MTEVYFIESESKRLYTVYHSPNIQNENNAGVILCNPFGQESIRCHKAYLHLATKLSYIGFHVIRFDYSGCGNSKGNIQEMRLDNWKKDIQIVSNELRESCFIDQLFLIGVRLGAALCELSASLVKPDGIVLWAPVENGRTYLDELVAQNKRWLRNSFATVLNINKEHLGFEIPDKLHNDISSINITKNFSSPLKRLIISNGGVIKKKMELRHVNTSVVPVVNNQFWFKENEVEKKVLVPIEESQTIQEWVTAFKNN